MHMVHHQTHASNFFFVSGLIWDVVLGTAHTRVRSQQQKIYS
jgi:sterol desaturase/sphingolipid hydroxylase (fatty acid hydroxylase superfamily)